MFWPKYGWMSRFILTALFEDLNGAQRLSTYRFTKVGDYFDKKGKSTHGWEVDAVFDIPGFDHPFRHTSYEEFSAQGFSRTEALKRLKEEVRFEAKRYKTMLEQRVETAAA